MTISTEYTPPQYIGNNTATVFAFPYVFYANSDLIVTRTQISTGVDTALTITTDYTISGGAGSSGFVTCVVAPTSDQRITIERSIPYKQDANFPENTAFPANTLETVLDKAVIMAQQTKAVAARALVIPASDSGVTTTLPTATVRAGKALFFDGSGNPSVTSTVDTVSAAAAAASASAAQTAQTAAEAAQAAAESASAGIRWRPSVKAATTANITLSAPQTIDGVSCIAGDRVLVKNQSTAANNGVYVVAAGSWTRASDADTWTELVSQAVSVEQGSTQADTQWICTSDSGGTLGVTAVTWAGFLTTPRDSSVTYLKVDPNAIATAAEIRSGASSKLVDAVGMAANVGWVLISTQTASSSSSLNFTSVITSTYNTYIFVLEDIIPATDTASLYLRTSTNNGSSYDNGAGAYKTAGVFNHDSAALSALNNSGRTEVELCNSMGNASGESGSGIVVLNNPLGTATFRSGSFDMQYTTSTPNFAIAKGGFVRATNADVDAVQFLMSSGNIASGVIRCYGIKK